MEGKKYVFVVGAYMGKVGESLTDYCTIEVFAKSEEEALEHSKKLIKKNYYEVVRIIEVEKKKEEK